MQREKVAKPPLTISDSVGVSSRAPRRINTLFWLFMFISFFILGPLKRPKALHENLPAACCRTKKQVAADGEPRCN